MENYDDKAVANSHLKQLLLQQINSQERVNARYGKILRRITYIYCVLSLAILGGLMFVIYSINKPESKIYELMKEVSGLETRTTLQRQYIEIDKNTLDSIEKELKVIDKKNKK
jgi:hypothetical protein